MLGDISIFDASLMVSAMIALAGGVISFLSPCVLPIVPPYLAYMAGMSTSDMTERRGPDPAVVTSALFFVMGLSTVFLLLGFAASALGRVFLSYQEYFNYAAGTVIILFGLHFIGLIRIPFLFKEARIDAGDQGGSPFGAYVLGLAFAFGWTPCIGPILGAILSMAAQDASFGKGLLLMGFYAIGLGVPFLLAAIFISRFMGVMGKLRRHMATIEKVMGGLLIVVGILLWTGGFADISFWLLEAFPSLAQIG
jgi:cytochrome c-type biogenesis protein